MTTEQYQIEARAAFRAACDRLKAARAELQAAQTEYDRADKRVALWNQAGG